MQGFSRMIRGYRCYCWDCIATTKRIDFLTPYNHCIYGPPNTSSNLEPTAALVRRASSQRRRCPCRHPEGCSLVGAQYTNRHRGTHVPTYARYYACVCMYSPTDARICVCFFLFSGCVFSQFWFVCWLVLFVKLAGRPFVLV